MSEDTNVTPEPEVKDEAVPAEEIPVAVAVDEDPDRAARLQAAKDKAKAAARKGADSNTKIEVREEDMGRPVKGNGQPVAAASRVVGGGERDDVFLTQIVYKNTRHKKSLTVHHLQARLNELGYASAAADPDGYYGDHTVKAVRAFQQDNGIAPPSNDTSMDATTFSAIFKDDPNVRVRLVRA